MLRFSSLKSLALVAGLVCGSTLSHAADNELTDAEKTDGWQLLFNGKDHTGWKCNTGKEIATPVEDGSLLPWNSGGYIVVYEKPFGDFELKCDVKMTPPACNSGIFFRVGDVKNPVYTGFEVAIDQAGDGYHDFGAVYDLQKPKKKAPLKPEWNTVTLRCEGPKITVSVNGEVVTEMDADQFDKVSKRPDGTQHKFGVAAKELPRTGHLGFQDHGKKVWYKNVKLRELKAK